MRESTVYVIWWQWDDMSGMGFIRAYADEIQANRDLELFKKAVGDYKNVHLAEIPLLEG